jgi:hypothetical protein
VRASCSIAGGCGFLAVTVISAVGIGIFTGLLATVTVTVTSLEPLAGQLARQLRCWYAQQSGLVYGTRPRILANLMAGLGSLLKNSAPYPRRSSAGQDCRAAPLAANSQRQRSRASAMAWALAK